jgi:hypothetical protein
VPRRRAGRVDGRTELQVLLERPTLYIDADVEPLLGATPILAVVAAEHDAKRERDFQQARCSVVDLAP